MTHLIFGHEWTEDEWDRSSTTIGNLVLTVQHTKDCDVIFWHIADATKRLHCGYSATPDKARLAALACYKEHYG